MKKLTILLMLFSLQAFGMYSGSQQIFTAASLGASVSSSGVDITKSDLISCQAVWAGGGAPNGTFTVEVSNDEVALPASVVNWSTYPSSSIVIAADGDLTYNVAQAGYRFLRIRYVRASGTATINAYCVQKLEGKP